MKVRADHRTRDVYAAPAAEQAARDARSEIARAEVKAAKALATIDRGRAYIRHGFASIHAWAANVGYGPRQTRRLLTLGRTLLTAPELCDKIRSGRVPSEAAESVGKVILEPALRLEPHEMRAWVNKASTVAPLALRDQAERAVEQARNGEPTLPLRFLVTTDARDGFRRARLLMSKGEPRWITEGAAFGRLVKSWLARHDPRRCPLPNRRSGPTEGRRSRYIPRRVSAIVERRSGGRCEVCRVRRATQKIHFRTPHAKGGSRETDNIADACSDCHVLVDSGVFAFSHFDACNRPEWSFHPKLLYGPIGRPQATRVRERAPPSYCAATGARGSRGAQPRRPIRSGAALRQRAPPFS